VSLQVFATAIRGGLVITNRSKQRETGSAQRVRVPASSHSLQSAVEGLVVDQAGRTLRAALVSVAWVLCALCCTYY
jgi:hypothetical protein